MRKYEPLDETEAATLKAQPHLGEGYESECLPGWIETFGRWHRTQQEKAIPLSVIDAVLHTLIAARRRNWLMADEIRRLQAEVEELEEEVKSLESTIDNMGWEQSEYSDG